MATVNFIPRRRTQTLLGMSRMLDYVEREDKTTFENEWLVRGVRCDARDAYNEFVNVKRDNKKLGGRLYLHLDQSFHPDERVTPKQAHEIAVELAGFYEGFQVIVATHVDKDHLHSHLVVNSVHPETGAKLHSANDALERLRKLSDELCVKHGLSTLEEYSRKNKRGVGSREYRAALKGDSWKFHIIRSIDDALRRSRTRQEFIENMEYEGVSVKWIPDYKYMTYEYDGHRCRDNKLHDEQYLKENMERLFDYREEHGFEPFTDEPYDGWSASTEQQESTAQSEPLTGDVVHNLARLGKDIENIPAQNQKSLPTSYEDSKARYREMLKKLAAGHKLRDEQEEDLEQNR